MTDRRFEADVLRMMRGLYHSDPPDPNIDSSKFPITIARLLAEPSRGRIVLFVDHDALHGYAVLIPYWSNEFGGVVLWLDELFVDEPFRRLGVAKAFFAFLEIERPFEARVLALEVAPSNARARALYESMGLRERSLRMMTKRLAVV